MKRTLCGVILGLCTASPAAASLYTYEIALVGNDRHGTATVTFRAEGTGNTYHLQDATLDLRFPDATSYWATGLTGMVRLWNDNLYNPAAGSEDRVHDEIEFLLEGDAFALQFTNEAYGTADNPAAMVVEVNGPLHETFLGFSDPDSIGFLWLGNEQWEFSAQRMQLVAMNVASTLAEVPEPTTLGLVAMSLLYALRRRR